jgi:ribosomal protein S18 acetylase RimI-like enzyme
MHPEFQVREAIAADHADFVRYFAELRTSDHPASRERWVADLMPHTFFLEEDGRKVGYAFVEVFGDLGYIRHVVVDASARGRGVGRALMNEIARRLRQARCKRWELNVKPDNLPAMRLYESVGMKTQHASNVVRIDWTDALRMPFDAGLSGRGVDPEEDDDIERDLGLPDGKLLRLREMTGQLLVQLVDAQGKRYGFARFDPEFPGAFPFRVTSPRHAGDLMRALHVHRSPKFDWVQLVIEDGADTTQVLLAAGARSVFDILHLAGDIPST